MRIKVKAKPRAREEKIEQISESDFIISVKEPPVKGLANAAIIKVVANHFKVSAANVQIVSGYTSRQKILEIK